jgi:hypothetical protein
VGVGCCVEEVVAAQRPCCEHCLPAPRPDANDDASAPENQKSPEACSNCCVCKGALVSQTSEVAAPEAQPLMGDSHAHDMSAGSLPSAICRVNADVLRLCGSGVRIALCSLLC